MRSLPTSFLYLSAGLVVGWTGALLIRPVTTVAPTAQRNATPAPTPAVTASSQKPSSENTRDLRSIVEEFLAVDWQDTVALIRSSGRVASLDDHAVRQAWNLLTSRSHTHSHQEKALALYLWSRLVRLDPALRFPDLWSREMNPEALLAERVRLSMDSLRQRLISGDPVDVYERAAFFKELAQKDPASGLDFWLRVSNHLEHVGELSYFSVLLRDPATREATLSAVRTAAGGDANELITALAGPWVVADLHESGDWIKTIIDPLLRDRLTNLLLVTSAGALPATAFEITEHLPVAQRTAARATGIGQLAYEDPATGMLLLETVSDPAERAELIRVFGNTLAMHDTDAWLAWRDTLPPPEHDHANSAAFTSWAVQQPAQAAAWLHSQPPGQERDQLAAELVRITAADQTETALAWINRINNPRDRLMAVSMALGNLQPGDIQRMETILRAALPPK